MRNLVYAAIALLAWPAGNTCADGMVYKCKNAEGRLIYQESPCQEDTQTVSSWAARITQAPQEDKSKGANGGICVVKQGRNGHYLLDGEVNGKALTFIVDTGASSVSLPRSLAFLAQMSCKDQIRLETAGGATSACRAVISTLKFGPFMIKDVPAVIVPSLDRPLLGMNVLSRFKIEQSNGEMRISMRD